MVWELGNGIFNVSKKTQPGYGVKQTGTASAYSLYLMLKQNIFP